MILNEVLFCPASLITDRKFSRPSIHNIYKNQMLNYNWVTLGDMFRPLNGHPQANLEQCC